MKITIEATPKEIDKVVSNALGRLSRYVTYVAVKRNFEKAKVADTTADTSSDGKLGYAFTWLKQNPEFLKTLTKNLEGYIKGYTLTTDPSIFSTAESKNLCEALRKWEELIPNVGTDETVEEISFLGKDDEENEEEEKENDF